MTTASELINRAYTMIGYKAADEPLSGAEYEAARLTLNDMVDGWNTDSLYIVGDTTVVTSVSGLPITIGPSMTINVVRPIRVLDGAFVRITGVDYPIRWITREQYADIAVKSITSPTPVYGYYDDGVPTGGIYLWPYPGTAAQLYLPLEQQLTEFADVSTNYNLAPGYRMAIILSLAELLCFGVKDIPVTIAAKASSARKAIRRTNAEIPVMSIGNSAGSPYADFISGL